MIRRRLTVAASLLLTLLASASARAADPVTIDVLLALTGPGAFLGQGEQQALQLAEKRVNETGGIGGRPLSFRFHDDQTNPQVAVQLAAEIIASKPQLLLGPSLVATCRAVAPLVKDGPVQYCFSPGIYPEAGGMVFTASTSTINHATALARYFRLTGMTRFALMFSTDASGHDAETDWKQVLAMPENKDISVAALVHFTPTDVSVSAQLATVKAADPQVFIAWSTGTPIATIFRGMVQAGLDVPVGTGDGNMTRAQMSQYAGFLPKGLYHGSAEWPVRDPTILGGAVAEKNKEFYAAFESAGLQPDIASELAWEPAMIVVHALRSLGPDASAEQIRNFIAHLKNYAGVDGLYDFERVPQRGLDVSDTIVTRWDGEAKGWRAMSKLTGIPLP
jgi:branched-chain amino acid transport system substrate-binding protein